MKRLGMMDAAFLYMETPNAPTHAAALQLFEPAAGGRDFYDVFRAHLQERIPLLPHLHQHLHQTPLDLDHPVWVANDDVDLSYHLRRERLDAPGTMEQLTALCEQLYPPLLDRTRPLWQYTVIDGLASGQVALFMKAHHACMDGMAAQATFETFFSATPEVVPAPVPAAVHTESEPGFFSLLRDAYSHLAEQPRKALKALPETARTLAGLGERFFDRAPEPAPRTRFDVSVSDERRFAVTTLSLGRVRAVARARGATINDLVMTLCGAALRRYLESHDELPDESLVAFAPVSLRTTGDGGSNNQVFGMMAPLATDVADPLHRLDAVREGTARAKALVEDVKDLVPTDFAMPGVAALVPGFFRLMSDLHVQERMPQFYNVTVSNVPGIRHPVYMSGARLVAEYPMSIVLDGSALNITMMGIEDALDFGIVACAKAVPDINVIRDLLVDAFVELERAVAEA